MKFTGTVSTLVKTNGKLLSSWYGATVAALLCFFIVLQSIFALVKMRKNNGRMFTCQTSIQTRSLKCLIIIQLFRGNICNVTALPVKIEIAVDDLVLSQVIRGA